MGAKRADRGWGRCGGMRKFWYWYFGILKQLQLMEGLARETKGTYSSQYRR